MSVDKMPAGREMDALVAANVMGWKFEQHEDTETTKWCQHCGRLVADSEEPSEHEGGCEFSTDNAAAWEVFEVLKLMPAYYKNGRNLSVQFRNGLYYVGHISDEGICFWHVNEDPHHVKGGVSRGAETFPRAICQVGLKAVGL